MEKPYKNLGYILLLFIPLTVLGFYKTYINQFPDFEESIDIYLHLHALIATIWLGMLITQPLLIRYRKNMLHKKIGKVSYVVFPLLILSFIPQMNRMVHSDRPINLFFPLADCILLMVFYSLAIYHRTKTHLHMRYMIGAALVFLGPTLGRIGPILLGLSESLTQNLQYTIIYLILSGLIWMDKKYGKKYTPYLLMVSMWIIHQVTFNMIF